MQKQNPTINKFCSQKNPATYVSEDFYQFFCSQQSCLCVKSHKQKVTTIQFLQRKFAQSENRGWEGYGKLIEFYNSAIRCLQVDRQILVNKIKTQKGPGLYKVQKKFMDYFNAGNLHSVSYSEREFVCGLFKPGGHQANLNKMILGIQKSLNKIINDARSSWFSNSTFKIQEVCKAGGKAIEDYLLDKIKYNSIQYVQNQEKDQNQKTQTQLKQGTGSSISSLKQLKSVRFSAQDLQELPSIKYFSPNLTKLVLSNQTLTQSQLKNHPVYYNITNLYVVWKGSIRELCSKFPDLRQLVLETSYKKDPILQLHYLKQLKNLTHLHLKQNNLIESFILELPNLEFLKLQTSYNISPELLQNKNTNQLKTLILSRNQNQFDTVFSMFSSLLHLDISSSKINNHNIEALKCCASLQTLLANRCQIGDKGVLSCIQYLHNLEKLDLSASVSVKENAITSIGVQAICQNNPKLTHLKLNNHPIGDRGAYFIYTYLKNIQVLLVRNCAIGESGNRYLCKLKNVQQFHIGSESGPRGLKILLNHKNLSKLKIQNQKVPILEIIKSLRNQSIYLSQTKINMMESTPSKSSNFSFFDFPKIALNLNQSLQTPTFLWNQINNYRNNLFREIEVPLDRIVERIVEVPRIQQVQIVENIVYRQIDVVVPRIPVQVPVEIRVPITTTVDTIVQVPRLVQVTTVVNRQVPIIVQQQERIIQQFVERVVQVPLREHIVERVIEIPRLVQIDRNFTRINLRKLEKPANRHLFTNELLF